MNRKMIWWVLAVILVVLTACNFPNSMLFQPTVENNPGQAEEANMANPASVNCEKNGGREETRQDAQGNQYGVCVFDDGSECESWAFMRGECQPGQNESVPSPQSAPGYVNEQYGFTFDPAGAWAVEGYDHYLKFRQQNYVFFVGFRRADEAKIIFRTGMPSGEFVDGGTVIFLGQELPKKLLVDMDGSVTRLVDYGSEIGVGDLRLTMWLDEEPIEGVANSELTLPPAIQAQADELVSSFALLSGETPVIELP